MTERNLAVALLVACLLAAAPADAGAFEDAVRARWRGAWVLTEIETYSTCDGKYFNNDVSGQFVAARAGRQFEPGELAKVDQLQVKRKKVELLITVRSEVLLPWQEGPFTLYRRATCQIELEVAIPRELLKSRDVESIDDTLAGIAVRYATEDEAVASSDWNGREPDEYPEDYELTLAHHAVWKAEETNRHIDDQIERALLTANELAREIDDTPVYLAGFAYGARTMRDWRERECGRLVGSTALTFRFTPPEEHRDNTTWTAGFYDGQALVYSLAIMSRLPGCYVEVPPVPEEYAAAELGAN